MEEEEWKSLKKCRLCGGDPEFGQKLSRNGQCSIHCPKCEGNSTGMMDTKLECIEMWNKRQLLDDKVDYSEIAPLIVQYFDRKAKRDGIIAKAYIEGWKGIELYLSIWFEKNDKEYGWQPTIMPSGDAIRLDAAARKMYKRFLKIYEEA